MFKISKYWLLYGGETITYLHKDEKKMIADIYSETVNQKYYKN